MEILDHGDADERSDMELAIQIGQVLERKYPGHPWMVGCQGRGIVIRHLAITEEMRRVLGKDGFCTLLPRHAMSTPSSLTHTATMFAGQLLEAFNLPRGAWDGRAPEVPAQLLGELP